MSIQIVLLGLASALRPSTFVAVYALVREQSPSRLIVAYVIGGLVFTLAIGAGILLAFSGIDLHAGTGRTKGIAEIAAGAVAIALGAALLVGRSRRQKATTAEGSKRAGRLRPPRMTARTAAIAGVVTHIPGLLYILALELIASEEPHVEGQLIQIGVYNALWFAPPILVLAVCIFDPQAARNGLRRFERWAEAHARMILTVVTLGLGFWLLIDGLITI